MKVSQVSMIKDKVVEKSSGGKIKESLHGSNDNSINQ